MRCNYNCVKLLYLETHLEYEADELHAPAGAQKANDVWMI